MADAAQPATQECPSCGMLIDVTDEQPLALCQCPTCNATIRVRQHFNHFELQEVLGTGGMGAVYRAFDKNLNRQVALKLLRQEHSQSPQLIESFAKEAAITASINHPHVVKVYSTGTDHGIFYIAMELVNKGSLDDLMTRQGKVAEAQMLDVGIQIAEGLKAAWQRGLIHRDVKPGNILFADAHNAKIVDFGLAVLQEHANTDGGAIWGTPYYVAPEKLETTPREDFRSDIYSLGATLFHAATGRPPFQAETASIAALRQLKNQPVSLQAVAPEMSTATAFVIDKMLQQDPAQRYTSYDDLIESLQYAKSELLAALDAARRRLASGDTGEKGLGWVTLVTAAIVVAAGVTAFTYRDQLFKPKTADNASSHRAAGPAFDAAYQKAREEIAAGHYEEAAMALRELDAQGLAPQPQKNWINLNAALAFLLESKLDEAKKEFEKIESRGVYSADPSEEKLANYFVDLAQTAASDSPRPGALAKRYDKTNYEGFALLLFAAKNWTLGAFDDAVPFFENFQSAAPEESYAWLNAYKPIAADHLTNLATYRTYSETAKSGGSDPDTLQKAVDTVKATREKLTPGGKFTQQVAELEASLSKKLAAAQEAKAMKDAEQDAAETTALAETLARVKASYAAFKFTEAAQLLAATPATNEKRKEERDAWAKRTEWLARFKATVISDINSVGYAQPLRRKNGTAIQYGLRQANDAVATMVTPYGNVPVPWTDLSVDSLTTIAQTFLRVAPPEAAADRQWQLGVFLYTFEKKTEALVMLHQAAESKTDYQPFLALFPET
jgi:hypothetical protein